MIHTYQVTGMTCNNCVNKVKAAIAQIAEVNSVNVSLDPPQAEINMASHIPLETLSAKLRQAGNFTITETSGTMTGSMEVPVSKLQTYAPLIVVFLYIALGVVISAVNNDNYSIHHLMNIFMGGFFIVFSMFKMLNLPGFAEAYSTYDVVARNWKGYGFIYPFIELGLGIAYFMHFNPLVTNLATLLVMGVSSIGVIQSLARRQQIRCACLGIVFNLPMSTITLLEDGLMVVMAVVMLVPYL
jgi:copper chaperone CopZ